MNLLLKDLCWHNGREKVEGDVRIGNGVIVEVGVNLHSKRNEQRANFNGDFLYPGLINAHDHLEMNLYPRLGHAPYGNYIDWARDIYHPTQSPVREIEKLNIRTRLLWGGLKNLIAGATTVVHHNPWHRSLNSEHFPVKVSKTAWAHSLAFEKNIAKKFPRRKHLPFVIHAAEGTDSNAFSEIPRLQQLGLLHQNTVLIHAVGLDDESIGTLQKSQSTVVWCPASNLFMFNRTAPITRLKNKVSIALGSDSTLTGSPTLLHEIHVASGTNLASPREIFEMVTRMPAAIFHLPVPSIAVGSTADLFVASVKNEDYFGNLPELRPSDISLVLIRGLPRLKNLEAEDTFKKLKNQVRIDGVWKYCCTDVAFLRKKIEKEVPLEILESNPLWELVET